MARRRPPSYVRRRARDPFAALDHALIDTLMMQASACLCECAAASHDDRGCRVCGPRRCPVPYMLHGDREASEARAAWLVDAHRAGNPVAVWMQAWARESPPADQDRPAPVAGEIDPAR